jgi:hypothetical protein
MILYFFLLIILLEQCFDIGHYPPGFPNKRLLPSCDTNTINQSFDKFLAIDLFTDIVQSFDDPLHTLPILHSSIDLFANLFIELLMIPACAIFFDSSSVSIFLYQGLIIIALLLIPSRTLDTVAPLGPS